MEKKINRLGLDGSIILNDPIKKIEEEYRKASIFVMSSRSEGFGMVLIEAMSYGLPCIAFDCPHGPADIIANNQDGYLIEDGDLSLFSDKIITLIKNDFLRNEMGGKAKENVTRYAPLKVIPQWDLLFKKLIK